MRNLNSKDNQDAAGKELRWLVYMVRRGIKVIIKSSLYQVRELLHQEEK